MGQDKCRATKSWQTEASNTYVEFKRTMGTNTRYWCENLGRNFSSEELSSEVLKALKSFVTDETVNAAVITVPAKFTVNQKTATLEAAKMAGISRCELLQEPIAAAMAYGLTAESKDGIWMVFDFGGGTFDAALLKVEDGIIQVFDTEGDNYLGGKNLDYAIVDNIIIPYLIDNYALDGIMADADKKRILRDAMKTFAEVVKNQLSFKDKEDIISNIGELGEDEDGEEIELDLSVTQEEVFDVMRPHFQKAVDICQSLMKRNHLTGEQIDKLILVGGPTHSPLIRQMLRAQITLNVDTSIDPMTAVATGAALYASTIDADVDESKIEMGTVMLDLGYEATTVDTDMWISAKVADNSPVEKVWIELTRSDAAWSSGRIQVDRTGDVIELSLIHSRHNSFSVIAYDDKGDRVPCFPDEISIICGTKVGSAVLPYNIGIAIWDEKKGRGVFSMAKGLEKNKPLPAIGVRDNLNTSEQIRPGVETDKLTIPVYQVDDFAQAEGRTASLYEYVADVTITGDDVDMLIPENSPVEVTLKVDTSEQMTLEVHFLTSDITVEKPLDTSRKQSIEEAEKNIRQYLPEAQRSIDGLKDDGIDTTELQSELDAVKDEAKNSAEKKAVLQHLKEVLRKIEDRDVDTEWMRLERELRDEFDRLERAQAELGNSKSEEQVKQLRKQTDTVIRNKDVKIGNMLLEQIQTLFFRLTMLYHLMHWIEDWNSNFSGIRWKDSARARQLLNRGIEEVNNRPTTDSLLPIVRELVELLPKDDAANMNSFLKQGKYKKISYNE